MKKEKELEVEVEIHDNGISILLLIILIAGAIYELIIFGIALSRADEVDCNFWR